MITCPKNRTEAFYYAICGHIPDKQYYHNPRLTDSEGKTVEDYLKAYSAPIPN